MRRKRLIAEAASLGLLPEDMGDGYLDDPAQVDYWPDNEIAIATFVAMGTQWRVGTGGATGLDYAALEPVLRLIGAAPDEWTDTFDCVRTLERAALAAMREGTT